MTRLAASVEASALIRRAEAAGDFGMVLRKGDPQRGSLLIVLRSRSGHVACLERLLGPDGLYAWGASESPESGGDEKVAQFLARRVDFDPDLWVVELNIAQPERFIAETTSAA